MGKIFAPIVAMFKNKKPAELVVLAVLGLLLFKHAGKLASWVRERFQGSIARGSALSEAASETNVSRSQIQASVRESFLQGLAETLHGNLHDKPLGFLNSWFGTFEDEDAVIENLNKVAGVSEARFLSIYYFQKYNESLLDQVQSAMDNSYRKKIRAVVYNSLS